MPTTYNNRTSLVAVAKAFLNVAAKVKVSAILWKYETTLWGMKNAEGKKAIVSQVVNKKYRVQNGRNEKKHKWCSFTLTHPCTSCGSLLAQMG